MVTQADLDQINKQIGEVKTIASGISDIFSNISGTGETTTSQTVQPAANATLDTQKTNYTPYIIGGVVLIGLVVLMRKKGKI